MSDLTCHCDRLQVILIIACVTFSPTKHCVWSHLLWLFAGDSDLHLCQLQPCQALCLISPVVVTICRWFWSSPDLHRWDQTLCLSKLAQVKVRMTCHQSQWQVMSLWLMTGHSDLHLCQLRKTQCLISPVAVTDDRLFWSSPVNLISPVVVISCGWFWSSPVSPSAPPSTVSDLTRCCVWFQVILIFTCVNFNPTKYGSYVFPGWADAIGLLLTLSSILAIPGVAIFKVFMEQRTNGGTILQVSGHEVQVDIHAVTGFVLWVGEVVAVVGRWGGGQVRQREVSVSICV